MFVEVRTGGNADWMPGGAEGFALLGSELGAVIYFVRREVEELLLLTSAWRVSYAHVERLG